VFLVADVGAADRATGNDPSFARLSVVMLPPFIVVQGS
jgi:hypothetical protein